MWYVLPSDLVPYFFSYFLCFDVSVKSLINIRHFLTYDDLEVINGFLVKFCCIEWFILFFDKLTIFNSQNGQFSPYFTAPPEEAVKTETVEN